MEDAIKTIKELGAKMNAQDNRATQLPLYVVQEKEKIVTHEDFADFDQHLGEEGAELTEDELCESCQMEIGNYKDSACVTCGYLKTLPVKEEWVFKLHHGVFLTGKACDEYIQRRRYEFGKEVRSYGISSYWSSDMASLLQAVSSLGSEDGKNKDFYRA